jgi:hypothetical protein
MAADLERAEIFVPVSLRHFRLRFDPEAKLIEVRDANRAVAHSVDQVLGGCPLATCSNSRSSASVAEDHPAHLIAQSFDFFRIGRAPEALGKVEKLLLSLLFRFDPVFD